MNKKFYIISIITLAIILISILFLEISTSLSTKSESPSNQEDASMGALEEYSENKLEDISDVQLPYNPNGPSIELIAPSNRSISEDGNINFTFTVSHSKLIRECALYHNIGQRFGPDKIQINTFVQMESPLEFNLNNLSDGPYIWTVLCEDEIYNQNAPAPLSFSIRKNAPESLEIPNIEINEDGVFSINLSEYFNSKNSKLAYETIKTSNNLQVYIDSESIALIEPEKNWFGETDLRFVAVNRHGLESESNLMKVNVLEKGDTPPRFVSLEEIGLSNKGVDPDGHIVLACNVTDDYALSSVSLYSDISGKWVLEETQLIEDLTKQAVFEIDNVLQGNYLWGCSVKDNAGKETISERREIIVEPEIKIINGILTKIVNNVDYPAFIGVEYSRYLDNVLTLDNIVIKDQTQNYFTISLSPQYKYVRGDIIRVEKLITIKNNEIFNERFDAGNVKELTLELHYKYNGNAYMKKENIKIYIKPGGWIL